MITSPTSNNDVVKTKFAKSGQLVYTCRLFCACLKFLLVNSNGSNYIQLYHLIEMAGIFREQDNGYHTVFFGILKVVLWPPLVSF